MPRFTLRGLLRTYIIHPILYVAVQGQADPACCQDACANEVLRLLGFTVCLQVTLGIYLGPTSAAVLGACGRGAVGISSACNCVASSSSYCNHVAAQALSTSTRTSPMLRVATSTSQFIPPSVTASTRSGPPSVPSTTTPSTSETNAINTLAPATRSAAKTVSVGPTLVDLPGPSNNDPASGRVLNTMKTSNSQTLTTTALDRNGLSSRALGTTQNPKSHTLTTTTPGSCSMTVVLYLTRITTFVPDGIDTTTVVMDNSLTSAEYGCAFLTSTVIAFESRLTLGPHDTLTVTSSV